MNFLYFIPGARIGFTKPEELPGELPNILDGASISCASLPTGPSGSSGILVMSPSDHGETVTGAHDPVTQTWIEGQGYWVGYETKAKPKPIDLLRPLTVGGESITLAGQQWVIPLIHAALSPEPFTTLPRAFRIVNGQPVLQVRDQYESICQETRKLCDMILGQAGWNMTEEETLLYCVRVLGINYRVGLAESIALELFDTRNMFALPQAALGIAMEKKTPGGPPI